MSTRNLDDISEQRRRQAPEGDEEVAYIVDGSGPQGTFVPGTDDLTQEIKTTLADYLSCLTAEANNSFPIDAGLNEVKLTDSSGYPSDFTEGGSNSQKFSGDLSNWSSNYLDGRSDSIRLGSYLSKGRPKAQGTSDGHSLLPSIVGDPVSKGSTGRATHPSEGTTPGEKHISQVLRSNRFNPTPGTSPFVENGTTPSVGARFRSNLGVYEGGVDIALEQLLKVGESLLLVGAGGAGADVDSSSGLFLGRGVQLGLNRMSPAEMDVRNVLPLQGVARTSLESDLFTDGGDPEYFSYGHVNTPTAPFDGFAPLGMIALGTLMTTTLIAGSQVIFGILSLIVNSDAKGVRLEPGPFILGQYGRPEADGLISTLIGPKALGLIHTENDFFDCARRGVNVFFGFTGSDIGTATETALLNLIQSPGYYVTVVRSILRSLNTISNAIRDVDFSNPIAGAQAVLGIVDVIKSSKIIGFLNSCAALGDILINQELNQGSVNTQRKSTVSSIDGLEDRVTSSDNFPQGVVQKPGLSVMKSRSRTGTNTLSLAWRSSAAPGMYLLPKNVINASLDFGSNSSLVKSTLGGVHQDKFRVNLGNRLSSDDVQAMEDVLEAEYVPFYFHDLRTNEIVSFHAFLKTLTDSYTGNYVETEGYGRIDPVNVYKSTKRSIDLSFMVAATSEEDFDEMWWKINKLTTLLYPQWGAGRSLESSASGAKFTQPFSQIPTASPLIRLRIGDVVKTNMSRFNLARVFGLGDATGFSPGQGFSPSDFDESKVGRIKDVLRTMMTDPDLDGVSSDTVGFAVGDLAVLRPTLSGFYTEASPVGGLLAQAAAILSTGSARRKVKIPVEVPVVIVARTAKQLDRTKLNLRTDAKTIYTVEFTGDVPGITSEGITSLEVSHADLKIDPSHVLVKSEVFTSEDIEAVAPEQVAAFFSPSNNFIVRSFDTVAGRGLAGFIMNMSFDWQTPTWETAKGKKAPKYCEVTLSFTPVHDLPPGLDDSGFNRAPLYSVGSIAGGVSGDIYEKSVDEVDLLVRQIYLSLASAISRAKST